MVRMPRVTRTWTGFVTLLAAWLLLPFTSLAAELEAKLDRPSVAAGNGAIMTLTIGGGRIQAPEMPAVQNLIIQPRGQSQQMQVMNGITTMKSIFTYVVGSETPGDYVIPTIKITINGQELSTQPLKLKVLPNGAKQPPAGLPQTQGGQSAPPQSDAEPEDESKRFGFLTVELMESERKHIYVGEIAPVRITAWLPPNSNTQLRSGIQPDGKGFTLHNVSDRPQQSDSIRDGKRYTMAVWFGGISAARPGKLAASLFVDANVTMRDESARRPRGIDPNDPFSSMFAPVIQKEVKLKSEDQQIEVKALPEEGRPANFHGPVGKFHFQGLEIPPDWNTGEPQQIAATIAGSGNFALMETPDLLPAEAWKSYPAKGDFNAGDQSSFSGSKTFRFSAVARKGGDREASLSFSFFEPDSGKYETITSGPSPVKVTGSDMAEEKTVPSVASPPKEPVKKPDALVAQHANPQRAATLVPLASRKEFPWLLGSGGGLCVLGLAAGSLRKRCHDHARLARAATEKATREALAAANAARDVPGFFSAARQAIQQRLAAMWNQPAHAITSAEIQARIPADSPVARFFQEADLHEYNRQLSGEIEPRWRTLLDEAMASLTPSNR